ncbi:hypothetical protein KKD52_14120 [Myxococcota bacterium]|nr:hypothetical protein [Myxococcota bacterium]MBU1413343.1 hypothetical protein [Myxococcota bacterium]MBU1511491.1 hypothetical protein [Myxococcota bacterium]
MRALLIFSLSGLAFFGCQFQSVEKVCFPGTKVCVDGNPTKYKVCTMDGMAWETRSCDPDHQCSSGKCVSDFSGDLTILTTDLPAGDNDQPYEFQLEVEGGTAPYGWQIIEGALPEGLILTSDGLITGAPGMPGDYALRFRVYDAADTPAWAEFSAVLSISISPLEVTGDTVYDAIVAKVVVLPFLVPYVAYSSDLQSLGGMRPHFWREAEPPASLTNFITSWGLPAGLTLTMSPGSISGTVESTSDAVGVTLPNGTTVTGYFLYLRTTDSQDPPDSVETVFCIPTIPI